MRDRATISCCMTAGGDAARVRAILALVRPCVDEIVLAVDDRRAEEILSACDDLVDVRRRYAFLAPPARYIGWIHHQCSGDWILRLDDDEAPSSSLLAALGRLVAETHATHVAFPRRWLHPTPGRWIMSFPWTPDHQVRLVRNVPGAWAFEGRAHHGIEVAGDLRRIPHPIWHLNLLLDDRAAREAKAARMAVLSPGAAIDGDPLNALYLPEAWERVETAGVPPEDRPLLESVLDPAHVPPPRATRLPPLTPVGEVDLYNRAREVREGAYRAQVRVVDARRGLRPGELTHLEVETTNLGTERWPPLREQGPPIRLTYRWRDRDGAMVVEDGMRTQFEEPVPPGWTTRTMLAVRAPDAPGEYLLEVDVVHEHVRWFEAGEHVRFTIDDDARPRPDVTRVPQSYGWEGLDVKLAQWLGDLRGGTFVEAGANDGVTQNNTLLLERSRGWSGLLVEPIPDLAEQCRRNRPSAIVEEVALVGDDGPGTSVRMRFSGLMSLVDGALGDAAAEQRHVADGLMRQGLAETYDVEVPAATLSTLLDRHGLTDVDLLVVDVEGFEAEALAGLDLERHRPRFICVEANFPDAVEGVLGERYEAVAELSHRDVLYRLRG
jgi:FkbM family methyltransferase